MLYKQVDYATMKPELGIHWDNEETKSKVERYISSCKAKLNRLIGAKLDYVEGTEEGELLIHAVEYEYYKKAELFEDNYQDDIISLRLNYQAEGFNYAEA